MSDIDKKPKARSRYIRAADDRVVRERNTKSGCEFVSADGEICGSHFQLQRDHITPHSYGGENNTQNLRLLCAQHNRFVWKRGGSTVREPEVTYV